jgi:peptidylprolyl isomerase domain and WD repeat-containing protein 1
MRGLATLHLQCLAQTRAQKRPKVQARRESADRFISLCLFQESGTVVGRKQSKSADSLEPLLVATAFDSQRNYLFTRRELPGGEDRDAFNERPLARGSAIAASVTTASSRLLSKPLLANRVTLHTNLGDISFATLSHCPRAVENFTVHSKNGYYDGIMYVRWISVLKTFVEATDTVNFPT